MGHLGRHYEKVVEDPPPATIRKYYFAGSTTIAMRENGTLYWILADHLGSTSVTTNANGTFNSEVRYTAFGEIWYSYNATPTDYLYTGQRTEQEIGLYYYIARFYDPCIMHYVQADTIIPQPGETMSFNRYAYVGYSPITYSDPTGHYTQWGSGGGGPHNPLDYLFQYANLQLIRSSQNSITDLDAMVLIVDKAAHVYDGDLDEMMPALTEVFMGTSQTGTLALISAVVNTSYCENGGCEGVGRSEYDCPTNQYQFGDEGFHEDFRDGDNQIFHVWGYIAQTYSSNILRVGKNYRWAIFGNVFHEIGQSVFGMDDGRGTSWQDYVLSQEGMGIGVDLTARRISGYELGNVLRERLSDKGNGSRGSFQRYKNFFGDLKGM